MHSTDKRHTLNHMLDPYEARTIHVLPFISRAEAATEHDVSIYNIPRNRKSVIRAINLLRAYMLMAAHDRPDDSSREEFFHASEVLEALYESYNNELDEELPLSDDVLESIEHFEEMYRIETKGLHGEPEQWLHELLRIEQRGMPGKEWREQQIAEDEESDYEELAAEIEALKRNIADQQGG